MAVNFITESEAVRIAEQHWNRSFKKATKNGEYQSEGGCPNCGDGGKGSKSDRLRLFTSGGNPRVWCRKCGYQVFIDNIYKANLSPEERKEYAIKARIDALERKQREHEQRITKLEQLRIHKPHIAYYHALTPGAVEYWYKEGIDFPYIDKYMLGYCFRCPTDIEGRPSYTIPVINNSMLYNVRHRLIGATNGDKYRPEMAGLGNQLFNTDSMLDNHKKVIIWEGEKKTIVLSQYIKDFANVGLMGKSGWNGEWTKLFSGYQDIVIAFDPDATENANKLGIHFKKAGMRSVRVAHFPLKPDDAIVKYGATEDQVRSIIEDAMPV